MPLFRPVAKREETRKERKGTTRRRRRSKKKIQEKERKSYGFTHSINWYIGSKIAPSLLGAVQESETSPFLHLFFFLIDFISVSISP